MEPDMHDELFGGSASSLRVPWIIKHLHRISRERRKLHPRLRTRLRPRFPFAIRLLIFGTFLESAWRSASSLRLRMPVDRSFPVTMDFFFLAHFSNKFSGTSFNDAPPNFVPYAKNNDRSLLILLGR